MTLQEIKDSDKVFLKPTDIAEILGCNAQTIRSTPVEQLGYPATRYGNADRNKQTRIPRKAFLKWLGEE